MKKEVAKILQKQIISDHSQRDVVFDYEYYRYIPTAFT